MPFRSIISQVPQHWVVCVLCSLALATLAIKNYCFDAIFTIVDYAYSSGKNMKNASSSGCPFSFSGNFWDRKEMPFVLPDYFYNELMMNLANAAFYSGKIIMLIPAGISSDVGYSKYILCAGMLMVAVAPLLFAIFVKSVGVKIYLLHHLIDGMGEGFIYPSIYTLISRWAPPSKRNLFTAVVVSGTFYGRSLGYFFLRLTYFKFRSLRAGYLITGIVGLLWFALGSIFIYHSPQDSPFILQSSRRVHRKKRFLHKFLQEIPWRNIVTSPPFISLVSAYISVDWATYTTIWISFPSYELYKLHLPFKFSSRSGIMTSISIISGMLIGGFLSDWLTKHTLISNTFVKKTFTFASVFIASILQVTAVLVGCNIMVFWILSITVVYFIGLANPVIYSSPIDLCSRHAGILAGILYVVKAICNILEEFVDDALIDIFDHNRWRNKIIVYSILSVVMAIPFLAFGSGEPQRWIRRNRVNNREERPAQLKLPATEPEPTTELAPTPAKSNSVWRSKK